MTVLAVLAQVAASDPSQSEMGDTPFVVFTVIKLAAIIAGTLSLVAILTLAERKIAAWIQDRYGPNRAGPGGLLQPAADGIKNFLKEEAEPAAASKTIFQIAPVLAFIPALLTLSVIPLAAPLPTPWGLLHVQGADIPIGFLYILAITSLGVYGITLAGWSSNNKYALLGGLRSSAQLVSYEIAMGLSTIPVLLLSGNVAFNDIIAQQAAHGFNWNVALLSVAFFTFMVAAFAETNRLPFDLPEAESELVAGYHTEYSGMKFAMFFLAEYANMITASAFIVTLFFGGWDVPFTTWDNLPPYSWVKTLLTFGAFATKTLLFLFTYIWIRWTLPRFRYDQLMSLGWKVMLPLALSYVVVVAAATLGLDALGIARGSWAYTLALLAMNVVLLGLVFVGFDRGRLVSPASARAQEAQVRRLRAVARARLASRGLDASALREPALASDAVGD